MDIVFEIVSRQKHSASFRTSHVFGEAGGYIGRSEECEWVLPDDRVRQISRKHALITFESGDFYIEDVSSNGIFFSLGHESLGKGIRHKIAHGEGFVIGEYTLMARLQTDPKTYAPSEASTSKDIHSFSQSLSLNPLTAIDQEEELIARQRLGDYDDLLGKRKVPTAIPADHTGPYISSLQPIVPVSESRELIPEDWDSEPDDESDVLKADISPSQTAGNSSPPPSPPPREAVAAAVPETDVFFKSLGFAEIPASAEERARILSLAANLLTAAVSGMVHALRNRHQCKNELRLPTTTTGFNISNNPLKFSPTEGAALATLLGTPQKGVLSPVESVRECFANLHSHHMGLLAGARAVTRASLEKIAPQAVEARLDVNGPVRFNRANRLWHTYIRMHQALRDNEEGFATLFLQDFARAYELQGRTLAPSPLGSSQGGQS
ncbi:MAG: type VI secretion system-associated FHA domain protein TagH [Desulfovibrio sp.]|jgi:type VI secretion system protein ImpI|nr:type VI secretion system-associated FHA domain protein TagH [Desulfovibrio sp.]